MQIGAWRSFQELEDNLCLSELEELARGIRAVEYRRFQADASIAGINVDDEANDDDPVAQAVKERAKQRIREEREAAGIDVEASEFADIGIGMIREEV